MSSLLVELFQVIKELPLDLDTVGAGVPVTVKTPDEVAAYPCVKVIVVGPVMPGAELAAVTVIGLVAVINPVIPALKVADPAAIPLIVPARTCRQPVLDDE